MHCRRLCTGLLVLAIGLATGGRSADAQEMELPPPAPVQGSGAVAPLPLELSKERVGKATGAEKAGETASPALPGPGPLPPPEKKPSEQGPVKKSVLSDVVPPPLPATGPGIEPLPPPGPTEPPAKPTKTPEKVEGKLAPPVVLSEKPVADPAPNKKPAPAVNLQALPVGVGKTAAPIIKQEMSRPRALVPVAEKREENPVATPPSPPPAFRLVQPTRPVQSPPPSQPPPLPPLGTPRAAEPPKVARVERPAAVEAPKPRGPALVVEKLTPRVSFEGQLTYYELVIRNLGGAPAFRVHLEDFLPPGAQYQGGAPPAEKEEDRLLWDLGLLEPGMERRCKVEVRLARPPEPSWPAAEVSFATGPGLPRHRPAPLPVAPVPPPEPPAPPPAPVVPAAAVGPAGGNEVGPEKAPLPAPAPASSAPILKVGGPEKVYQGEMVPLTIEITNPGTAPLTGLLLRDHLPAGLEHPQGQEIEATLGAVRPGETRRIDLAVRATQAGWQINKTSVAVGGKVLATAQAAVLVAEGGGLQVRQNGPVQTLIDRDVEYRIEIRNAGATPAQGVRVSDFLPLGLEFIAAGEGGSYDRLTRIITWQLGTIPAGQARRLSVKFRPRTAGEWTNRVVAQPAAGGPVSGEAKLSVGGVTALVLEVNARENQAEVGAETVFDIRALNRGSQGARGVQIVANVPAGMQPLSAEGQMPYRLQGQQVIFTPLSWLAAGAEARFQVRVRCQTPGDMRLRVQLTSEQQRVPVYQEENIAVR